MDRLFAFLKNFSFEKLLPDLDGYMSTLKTICTILVLVGPLVVLVLGILYKKRPPKDMDSRWGFSNILTRKDPEIWDAAHALTGKIWTIMGAALLAGAVICSILFIWMDVSKAVTVAIWAIGVELVAIVASWFVIMFQLRKV